MTAIDCSTYEKLYCLTLRDEPEVFYEVGLHELAVGEGAHAFVDAYAPEIKALERDVAGTYFASWYGRVCAAFHYALWHDASVLDLSLSRVALRMHRQEGRTSLSFRLREWDVTEVPEGGAGADRMAKAMEEFYSGQVRPLLESVAAAAEVPVGALWGMLATGHYHMMDTWQTMADSEERRERLAQLADILVHELGPEVFGRKRNPYDLKFRMVENPREPGARMRLKATCCLAYKTDTGYGCCYTCPRLTDAAREEKKQQLQAKARMSDVR